MSVNLSQGGLFVDCEQLLAVGTPITCRLPLVADDRAIEVGGRVAWLRPIWSADELRPRGMGIEFEDLSPGDGEALRGIVGSQVEQSHAVRLRLPGLPSPVSARAVLINDGIFLRTALPFLRIGSDVDFSFVDDDLDKNYRGRVAQVAVCAGEESDVPRLHVEVELSESGRPLPSRPTSHEEDPMAEYELFVLENSAPHPILGDPTERTVYPEPRRQARWLMPAIVAVAGATLVLGLWYLARRGTGETTPAPAISPAGAETARSAPTARTSLPAAAAKAKETVAKDAHEDKAGAVARPALATDDPAVADEPARQYGAVSVEVDGETTTVRVPFTGSSEGASDYRLANPDGVAINLPEASPVGGYEDLDVDQGGVRLIWIRERKGGLHVRVFTADSVPSYVVSLSDAELIVELQR